MLFFPSMDINEGGGDVIISFQKTKLTESKTRICIKYFCCEINCLNTVMEWHFLFFFSIQVPIYHPGECILWFPVFINKKHFIYFKQEYIDWSECDPFVTKWRSPGSFQCLSVKRRPSLQGWMPLVQGTLFEGNSVQMVYIKLPLFKMFSTCHWVDTFLLTNDVIIALGGFSWKIHYQNKRGSGV